mgnify:CR=1 FL=1
MTLILAIALAHPLALPAVRSTASLGKGRKEFVEIPQSIQYEGDYSPPAGRPAPPEASPFQPVQRARPWEKDIPIIVKPKPRYIDEAPQKAEGEGASNSDAPNGPEGAGKILSEMVSDASNNANNLIAGNPDAAAGDNPQSTPIQPVKTPGSATGSKATVNYATTPGFTP